MPTASASRTARDSIKRAAMEVVAERGSEGASLRAIAVAAGVSPALVNHHFGSHRALLDETERDALALFAAAYQADAPAGDPAATLRARALATQAVMRDHPEACDFIGRRLAEGHGPAGDFLARMLRAGRREIGALQRAGAIGSEVDPLWATVQHFLLIWAPLTFRASLESLLGGPLFEEPLLERWSDANEMLLRRGLYADA